MGKPAACHNCRWLAEKWWLAWNSRCLVPILEACSFCPRCESFPFPPTPHPGAQQPASSQPKAPLLYWVLKGQFAARAEKLGEPKRKAVIAALYIGLKAFASEREAAGRECVLPELGDGGKAGQARLIGSCWIQATTLVLWALVPLTAQGKLLVEAGTFSFPDNGHSRWFSKYR